MSYRLGVDVGGTFTDFLLYNERTGRLHLTKVPSTPADQSVAVLAGIHKIADQAGIDPNAINLILHGTTVATNAVLEGKGARVGLITTKGFEQILHVARGQTPGPLAGWIIMIKPEPLAPLDLTRGLSARMDARGQEMAPLDEDEARWAIRELHDAGIEALTVSLLNAYANPAHEQRVKALALEMYPDLPVTISTDILPEFREYERTLTTVMNSYVRPKMRTYLTGMQQKLVAARLRGKMNIVRSDGGVMSLEAAAERPVNTLLSGPSGGAVAASYIGELAGFRNVLSFDMGGTSTDVAISFGGSPNIQRETRVGYYPVKAPSVDVRTVGAGGGSIAHVPLTGALRVGPQSAGAEPGPACYGLGGTDPTVTDANVVLGYLPPRLLGGEMLLKTDLAAAAVGRIADAMGLPLLAAAEGIYDIVNENMFGALRLVSVQRGYDPADFALVALGGAGPLHANALSMLLGSWPSIIPPTPGVLSALGFLHSDIRNEFSRTVIQTLAQVDRAAIRRQLRELGREAQRWLASERIPAAQRRIQYQVDLRYHRQGYEFPIDVDPAWLDRGDGFGEIVERFKAVHAQNYGFNIDHEIELVNVRAVAIGVVPKVEVARHRVPARVGRPRPIEPHRIYYRGRTVAAPIYDRYRLEPGQRIDGPAVVTQNDSTTLILPGHHGEVDAYENILIWPDGHRKRAGRAPAGRRTATASRRRTQR
jgi:N-methylhydantoinase A